MPCKACWDGEQASLSLVTGIFLFLAEISWPSESIILLLLELELTLWSYQYVRTATGAITATATGATTSLSKATGQAFIDRGRR